MNANIRKFSDGRPIFSFSRDFSYLAILADHNFIHTRGEKWNNLPTWICLLLGEFYSTENRLSYFRFRPY